MEIIKRVNKILNKKIYVGEAIGDVLIGTVILIVLIIFYNHFNNETYEYIDYNNKYGTSNNCYTNENGYLYCETFKLVKQYSEKIER